MNNQYTKDFIRFTVGFVSIISLGFVTLFGMGFYQAEIVNKANLSNNEMAQ